MRLDRTYKITSVPDIYFCPKFRIQTVFQSQEPSFMPGSFVIDRPDLLILLTKYFSADQLHRTYIELAWVSQCWVDKKMPTVWFTTVPLEIVISAVFIFQTISLVLLFKVFHIIQSIINHLHPQTMITILLDLRCFSSSSSCTDRKR